MLERVQKFSAQKGKFRFFEQPFNMLFICVSFCQNLIFHQRRLYGGYRRLKVESETGSECCIELHYGNLFGDWTKHRPTG